MLKIIKQISINPTHFKKLLINIEVNLNNSPVLFSCSYLIEDKKANTANYNSCYSRTIDESE